MTGARFTFADADRAMLARVHLESIVIPRIAVALGVPEVNAAAVICHLLGLNMADSILGIRQLDQASEDELVALIAPVIGQYLTPELS